MASDDAIEFVAPRHFRTLVDSAVLLDVLTEDPTWAGWSADHIADARDRGELVVNPIATPPATAPTSHH